MLNQNKSFVRFNYVCDQAWFLFVYNIIYLFTNEMVFVQRQQNIRIVTSNFLYTIEFKTHHMQQNRSLFWALNSNSSSMCKLQRYIMQRAQEWVEGIVVHFVKPILIKFKCSKFKSAKLKQLQKKIDQAQAKPMAPCKPKNKTRDLRQS